ncbi:MAG: sugar phosphate isomerase/epimerase [Hadesarchaea archaeon]|nr:sugar phosphate isomerase/epimerase [Hadesarchaea archaeon]
MKLGRNFTNLLYFDYLDAENKRKFLAGELTVTDMDATVQTMAKKDIAKQVLTARALGIDHVELDGAVPNPYLAFSEEDKQQAKAIARENNISLSLHLPYSYVGASLCAPDELDRKMAVSLQKRYIEFASDIGCKYCILHPGVVPFYHMNGKYLEQIRSNLIKSLAELASFAAEHDIDLHVENNTAFDGLFSEPSEICEVLEKIWEMGLNVYFCFDIGHWLTRADAGKRALNPPERVVEEIPNGLFKEVHLNDYVPGKRIFHPPLHLKLGLLGRENLERYLERVVEKGAEVIVVETAASSWEHVIQRNEILREETGYLKDILGRFHA